MNSLCWNKHFDLVIRHAAEFRPNQGLEQGVSKLFRKGPVWVQVFIPAEQKPHLIG